MDRTNTGNITHALAKMDMKNEETEKVANTTVEEGQRKSAVVTDEAEMVVPSDELVEKIIRQVEFYLSDTNILNDVFLFNNIHRNKEGYLSLKLIASFRKVKSLAKDWRVVAYSLEKSTKLKFNKEKTKICRINPIPKYEDTIYAKSVIAFNLPVENPTSDDVKVLFNKFGTVRVATVMNKESEIIHTCVRKCLEFHKDIATATYAVVEYENHESALEAIKDKENESPNANGLKVVPLMPKSYKHLKSAKPKTFVPNGKRRNNFKSQKEIDGLGTQKGNELHCNPEEETTTYSQENEFKAKFLPAAPNPEPYYKKQYYKRPYRGTRVPASGIRYYRTGQSQEPRDITPNGNVWVNGNDGGRKNFKSLIASNETSDQVSNPNIALAL